MPVEDVPDDFRGPRMKPLADRIADNGMIDAAVFGAHLKQLWHVLVHYGDPAGDMPSDEGVPLTHG